MSRNADRDARILEERALRLAGAAMERAPEPGFEVVLFDLAGERWGLEAAFLHEVFLLTELAPLPGVEAPEFGVTVWRGGLLRVLDLRLLLGLSPPGLTDLGHALVLGRDRPVFAVLADAVVTLTHVRGSDLRPPPEGTPFRRDWVRGVTPDAWVVLDAEGILRLHA